MNARRCIALLLACLLLLPALAFAEEPEPAKAPEIIRYLSAEDAKPELGVDGLLEVHLINVASADCILLRMGQHTVMIDSGRETTWERIAAYLDSLGIESLDYAFGSHPHDDHIGGFVRLLETVPVSAYLQPRMYEQVEIDTADALAAVLKGQGIEAVTVENDTVIPFGDATLTFMQWQDMSASQNNRSMIVRAALGERSILFTADIGANGQKTLAEMYGETLQADILKGPHHGLSEYRRELHDVVLPQLVTFSNIKDKIYEVLRTVEKRGAKWMLTTKGTIVAVTDGETWQVWQAPPEAK